MKILIYQIIFLLIQVYSKIPEPEKKFLLFKYAKKVDFNEITTFLKYDDENEFKTGISYDPQEITNLITKYGFSQSYNFFKGTNVQKVVKDQKNCGSCWSFSATSSLAYRFNKLGYNFSLSPQYGLSCTIRDCEAGNNYIDPQLDLIKNGTITESCFPYESGDGKTIPSCPNKCKNNDEEFKKYFAKNAYVLNQAQTTEDLYNSIAIIMDELINHGPMSSLIYIYDDFRVLHNDAELCAQTIYHHDGNFENQDFHAVTIVGYGFQDNKYYWLMQNSWGENDCDHGFFKVEFGQINAEQVSFSEPYIEDKTVITTKIDVTGNVDTSCNLNLKTNMDLNNWKSPLNIKFKHDTKDSFYNAFCGIYGFKNQEKNIVCNFDYNNFFSGYKGKYKFYNIESLGHENEFEALDELKEIQFFNYGIDNIYLLSKVNRYFISEEGSRFSFLYIPNGKISDPFLRPSFKRQTNLFCKLEQFSHFIVGYCDIKNENLDYFFDEDPSNDDNVIDICLCFLACNTDLIVQKLNKQIHPVFRITNFTINETETETTQNTSVYLYSNIEGGLSDFYGNNIFEMLLIFETNGKNEEAKIACKIGNPTDIQNNYIIKCDEIDGPIYKKGYIAYLKPYYAIEELNKPFEIIINQTYRYPPESHDPKATGYSSFIQMSLWKFIGFMLLF